MLHSATARLTLLGVLFCAALARAQEAKPIVFEVRLPPNATLEIGGYKTTSTGASRSFETPAVAPGKTYVYVLKATDGGKVVVKEAVFKAGGNVVFDLRPDFETAKPLVMPKDTTPTGETPRFVTFPVEGRLWVFRTGSKELAQYKKDGDLEKHVTRIGGGPKGVTIKAPDADTIDAFMKAQKK